MERSLVVILMIILLGACQHKRKISKVPVPLGMDETADSNSSYIPPVKTDTSIHKLIPDSNNIPPDDALLADGSKPVSWSVAGITDVRGLKLFIKDLQQKVIAGRMIEIGSEIKFPLKKVKNLKDFYNRYNQIFSPAVKSALADVNLRQLFRNSKGVMIGKGKIWIARQAKEYKIIGINY